VYSIAGDHRVGRGFRAIRKTQLHLIARLIEANEFPAQMHGLGGHR